MRVFRVPDFIGVALMLGLLATLLRFMSREVSTMDRLEFDVAHLFAGSLVLVSFMLLYQDRLYALFNMFALQALVLALSVSWQASSSTRRISTSPPASPWSSRRSSYRWPCIASWRGSASTARWRPVVSVVPTMLAGIALVALSMVVMLRVTTAPTR